jgi:hypothetical protein
LLIELGYEESSILDMENRGIVEMLEEPGQSLRAAQ